MKSKFSGFLIMILFIALIVAGIVAFFNNKNVETTNNQEVAQKDEKNNGNNEEKKDVTFSLTALGDVLCHNTQYWDAYNKSTDTYDFSYVFENVKEYTLFNFKNVCAHSSVVSDSLQPHGL